jgi:TonB family protein
MANVPHAPLYVIILLFLSASTICVKAQDAKSPRELIYKVAPKYPSELKQNEIGGIVRLSISISPNGSVGKVSVIGGHPVLVDTAIMAVKQWKYKPADHPTSAEVRLNFVPH